MDHLPPPVRGSLPEFPAIDSEAAATRELLQAAVDEAVALVRASGGFVYLLDRDGTTMRRIAAAGLAEGLAGTALTLPAGAGMVSRVIEQRGVAVTGDYQADTRFVHAPETDQFALDAGVVSMVAAPLVAGDQVMGAMVAFSRQADAFGGTEAAVVRSLAAHAATSLANDALIGALGRTADQLARRSERERTLRELVGSLAEEQDPGRLLDRILEAVIDATGAGGALVDRLEPNGNHTHVSLSRTAAGMERDEDQDTPHDDWGLMGLAMCERRMVVTGDYLVDRTFEHNAVSDSLCERLGVRSVVAVPLILDGAIQGVLAAHSDVVDAFDGETVEMMTAFAHHAAVAIANARRVAELDRSRSDLARRASEERALREIGATLATVHHPDQVLAQAVEAVCRLVDGEWAEIARLDPDGTIRWTHVHGLDDQRLLALQAGLQLRLGEGMLGKAAAERRTLVTGDYLSDGSFRHVPKSDAFARQAGFRSLVAAPLVGSDDAVIGILAVHSTRPEAFDASHAALVDTFATIAAVAMGNARLIDALDRSEARYRYLVDNSPDVVWAADATGNITYISETSEELLGWRPEEVVGRHFSTLIHPTSLDYVRQRYADSVADAPDRELRYRFSALHRDGSAVPLEMHARTITEDGVYRGTHGACRDVRERERLERDLQLHAAELAASEERAHLARELHDSVTQALFSMTLVTKSIELLLDADPAQVRGRLAMLAELQADALAEMRALIFELRPASLRSAGLVSALHTHCAALQGRTGLEVEIDTDDVGRLPDEVETTLFRVAQEALNNVVKHAAARSVRVGVARAGGGIVLEVRDDGRGFDGAEAADGHLGISGMRARLARLDGTLVLESAPDAGTLVRAAVPLPLHDHGSKAAGPYASMDDQAGAAPREAAPAAPLAAAAGTTRPRAGDAR